MKKLLLFLLLLCLPMQATAAIAFVSSATASSSDGKTITTGSINTTGANLIVISTSTLNGGNLPPTDSKSNTWTPLTAYGSVQTQLYYSLNPTVGTGHTFTITGATFSFPALAVMSFSGVKTTLALDRTNGNSSAATSLPTGSVSPSQTNELVITGSNMNSSNTPTVSGSFSAPVQTTGSDGYNTNLAYIIETAAVAQNPTWTGSASGGVSAAIATFKSTSGVPVVTSGALTSTFP